MAEKSTRPPTVREIVTGRPHAPGRLRRLPIPQHVRDALRSGHAIAARRRLDGGWVFYNKKCREVDGSWNTGEHRRIARWRAALGARLYVEDTNPIHVWRALLEYRAAGEPLPEWILGYLERVARRIYEISSQEQPPKNPAGAVAEALEMKKPGRGRRGTVFVAFRQTASFVLALDVQHETTSKGKKPYRAWRDVAKKHKVSRETVRRAWLQHRDTLHVSDDVTDRLLAPFIAPSSGADPDQSSWNLERLS